MIRTRKRNNHILPELSDKCNSSQEKSISISKMFNEYYMNTSTAYDNPITDSQLKNLDIYLSEKINKNEILPEKIIDEFVPINLK